MTGFEDAVPTRARPERTLWYGKIASNPAATDDLVWVIIPDLAGDDTRVGPCMWQARDPFSLPARDDACLVGFDNQGRPWVQAWWPLIFPDPDSLIGPQGPQGIQGPQGPAGANGADYISPFTDTGWQRLGAGMEIPYVSASDYTTPYGGAGVAAIRRLPSGLVIGKGLITPPAAGGNCFTIPAGMRPASTPGVHIVTTGDSGTENERFRIPTVANNGGYATAWGVYMAFSRSWVTLNGVLWFAEQ